MPKFFLLYLFLLLSYTGFCQKFISPYKDGHSVPDSVKDYSASKKISLLENGSSSKKAKPQNKVGDKTNAGEKSIPNTESPSKDSTVINRPPSFKRVDTNTDTKNKEKK